MMEAPQHDQKKQQILNQINKIRANIETYKKLQKEVDILDKELSMVSSITKSQNSFESPKKKKSSNSHKKIKIYELQKKVNAKHKQQKEKQLSFIKKIQHQECILEDIKKIKACIQNQKQTQQLLSVNEEQLGREIYQASDKCDEIEALMQDQKAVVEMYEEEKERRILEIKRIKKQLKMDKNNTEPDDSFLDLSQEDGEHCSLSSDRKLFTFEKITPQFSLWKNLKDQNMSFPLFLEKVRDLLEEKVEQLEKSRAKSMDVTNLIHQLRIQNRKKEGSVKHYKTTIDLSLRKNEALQKNMKKQIKNTYQMQEQIIIKERNLGYLEGERGKLRGKLGIKVENVRLLGLLNEEMRADLDRFNLQVKGLRAVQERIKLSFGIEKYDDFLLQNI